MGGMENASTIPWLLIGLGVLVILAIVVLLTRMRKEKGKSAPMVEKGGEAEVTVRAEEERTAKPVAEKVSIEVTESKEPVALAEEQPSETMVPGPPTIKEPIDEIEGIDRGDFAKFSDKQVLVVEDNKINQKLILTLLGSSGIDIETADDGAEALEKMRAPGAHFDLVLMDVNMPKMDGLEATREIRKESLLRDTPVVALTASTSAEEVEAILESGMNAYLDKPINLGKLYHAFEIFTEEYRREPKKRGEEGAQASTHAEAADLDTEVLDLSEGLKYSNNDEGLYRLLLEDFLVNYKDSDMQLAAEIGKKDYGAIHAMIVDLEGISGTLGAKRLYALTQKIRQVLQRQTYGILPDYLEEYREELGRLKEEIQKYLAKG